MKQTQQHTQQQTLNQREPGDLTPEAADSLFAIIDGMAEDTYRFFDAPAEDLRQVLYSYRRRLRPRKFTAVDYGSWTVVVCEPSPETKRLKYGRVSKEQGPPRGGEAVQAAG